MYFSIAVPGSSRIFRHVRFPCNTDFLFESKQSRLTSLQCQPVLTKSQRNLCQHQCTKQCRIKRGKTSINKQFPRCQLSVPEFAVGIVAETKIRKRWASSISESVTSQENSRIDARSVDMESFSFLIEVSQGRTSTRIGKGRSQMA